MMTIDIDTISGVPLTGELKTRAPDDVGADQKAEQQNNHRRGEKQRAHDPGVHVMNHVQPSPQDQKKRAAEQSAARFAVYLIL